MNIKELFSIPDILWHVLNILLLFAGIRIFLYKPVRSFMDKRTAKFVAQKDEASSLLNDARTQHQHSQELVQQAAIKAANVVAESAGQAQAQADAIIAEAKAKAQLIVDQAKTDSLQIRQQNQAAMQTQAVQLAVEIASKILEREVSTQDHQNIIDKFLTKVK